MAHLQGSEIISPQDRISIERTQHLDYDKYVVENLSTIAPASVMERLTRFLVDMLLTMNQEGFSEEEIIAGIEKLRAKQSLSSLQIKISSQEKDFFWYMAWQLALKCLEREH